MRLIGATAEQGRMFTDAETEVATKAPVAVLSHEAWETRFGSDPAILGKTVVLNGQPHTVVGVTRPRIQTPFGTPDVYHPDRILSERERTPARKSRCGRARNAQARRDVRECAERDLRTLASAAGDGVPDDEQGLRRRAAAVEGSDRRVDAHADLHRLRGGRASCCSSRAPTSPTCSSRAAPLAIASCRFAPHSAPDADASRSNC